MDTPQPFPGSDPTATQSSKERPEHIGPYRAIRRLALDATSETILAVSSGAHGFERYVAIKRLLPHAVDPSTERSFGREATAYARLTHPAIVRLYDFFTVGDVPAMVLEHVEGVTLKDLLSTLRARRMPLDVAAALYVGAQIFAALAAAHAARDPMTHEFSPVIHRDVTPSSVLLTGDGEVKLSSFAFAKLVGKRTDTSALVGHDACEYMAPEQLMGERVTVGTDLYAAALVVREMILGEPAFLQRDHEPYLDFLQRVAEPQLSKMTTACTTVPLAVRDALDRALEMDPEARTVTAADLERRFAPFRDRGRAALVDVMARVGLSTRRDEIDEVDELLRDSTTVVSARPAALAKAAESTPAVAWDDDPPSDDGRRAGPTLPPLRARPSRFARGAALVTGAAIACAIVGVTRPLATRTAGARSATVVQAPIRAPEPMHVSPPPQITPEPPPIAPPPMPSLEGELRTPRSSHRLFVDGRVVGAAGDARTVACGTRVVQIGSGGRPQKVDVPCGGAVDVAP